MPWSKNVRLIDDNGTRPKKSKSAPALDGSTGYGLVMVHLGDTSDRIWWSRLREDGTGWTADEQVLVLQAEATPALASKLMLYPDARSGRLFKAGIAPWVLTAEPRDAEGRTMELHIRPALALSGDIYHLFLRAERGDMAYLLFRDGFLVNQEKPGNENEGLFLTHTRPAVAIIENTIHLAYLGTSSNQIWHAKGQMSFDRDKKLTVQWVQKRVGGQKSQASPALAIFNGWLHMVHIGDSSTSLWHAIYIPEFDSWTQDEISPQRSKTTPGLAAFNGTLHMVHLDADSNQLWWSRWRHS